MKINSVLLILSVAVVLSCNNKEKLEASTETQQNVKTDSLESQKLAVNGSELPVQKVGTISGAGNKNLNPAHGEPNHRCDIEVGAPLDSAPQTAPQQVMPQQTLPQQAVPQSQNSFNTGPTNSGAKPALNPEHGQPHHRCDLQVGAPLS